MPKELNLHNFIKHHPEIFETNGSTESHVIDDTKIPDLEWFYKRNRALLSQHGKATTSKAPWYRTKRFLMPAAAVMVLAVFLGGTPTGRAMAMTVYNTVFGWDNGQLNISQSASGSVQSEIELEEKNFRSFADVEAEYGITAVKTDMDKLVIIEAEKTEFQLILHSTYSVSNDKTILVTQTIDYSEFAADIVMNTDADGVQIVNTKTRDGVDVAGYVYEGIGFAVACLDRTSIEVYSEDITYPEFISFVESLTFT